MSSDITIYRLCDKPEWVDQCQAWDEAEWPRTAEIADFFDHHYLQASQNYEPTVPQTFIALHADKMIGMLSIIDDDHPEYTHLGPWIASVYVTPHKRKSRAVYMMLQKAVEYTKNQLKLDHIYTYTHLNASLKRWEFLQTISDPFDPVHKVGLYRYDLTKHQE